VVRFAHCVPVLFGLVAAAPVGAQVDAHVDAAESRGTPDPHLAAAPLVRAERVQRGIHLDGILDEADWAAAQAFGDFIQTDPREGLPATEPTEVRILYDDDAIYVGARMWESAGEIRKRLGRRDAYLADSDWFYVMLDSYHDHLSAYQFSVNPAGVKRDEITGGGGHPDASWDAVWEVATTTDSAGWTAEIRIPFSQLRFNAAPEQTWGVQFSRRAISKEEVTVLSYTPKSERGGVARYGHLQGLRDIRPGRRMELLPYTVSRAEYRNVSAGNPFRDGSDWFTGAGLDLKYRLTSSLTLDATFNPDFGQVEVDPAVVNLSAFETSFDEKRPFFVEGSSIFRFDQMRLFYSRRIGRRPQGGLPDDAAYSDRPTNTTILGAAKITGQTESGWNIGVVQALTSKERAPYVDGSGVGGEATVEPLTNYLVARAEKNLRQGETQIGGILTSVNRSLGEGDLSESLRSSAYTGGLDFRHEFRNRTWEVNGYFAASRIAGSPEAILRAQRSSARYYQRPDQDYLSMDSSATTMEGFAGRLELQKTAGLHWRGQVSLSATSPGFEINDIGFQTAADRASGNAELTYVENRPGRTFRFYRLNLRASREWNFGREAQGGRISIGWMGQFANYWGGSLNFTRSLRAEDDRLTRGGPTALDLPGQNVDLRLNTDDRRKVVLRTNANYSWGESGGWHRQVSGSISLRPQEFWTISLGPRLSRSRNTAQYLWYVEDPTATATWGNRYIFAPIEQTTLSMETRLNVNVSPDVSFDLYAQPFVSTGDFGDPVQLRAPGTYAFDPYDGDGRDDFNTRSLRGNAVMRWEWRPGSTVFLVWQQQRSGSAGYGRFDFERDTRAIFEGKPENVFLVKLNYWLNL
jgi:hypothetical protein